MTTRIQIFVDNQIVSDGISKNCMVSLENNSKLKIYASNTTFNYVYEASSKTLKESSTGSRVYCQNQSFLITININPIEYKFYLNYEDNSSKYAGIKHIKAYNATTGTWENLSSYSNYSKQFPMPVYLTSDFTQIEIEYQN